jgi:hypothetical protein
MKKLTKLKIVGLLLLFLAVLSIIPLFLITSISAVGFLYSTISWAMMSFIGIFLSIWCVKITNEKNKVKIK